VLDDDEAVFGVLEGGREEAAYETEDEDVALHGGVLEKCNGDGEEVPLPERLNRSSTFGVGRAQQLRKTCCASGCPT
jgi:hypothetical protein